MTTTSRKPNNIIRKNMEIKRYIQAATDVYGESPLAKNRQQMTVWGRFAVYQTLKSFGLGASAAAVKLNTDHASAIYAWKQHDNLYNNDKLYTSLHDSYQSRIGKEKCYIAGKITGLDNYKELFEAAEHCVKKLGLQPVNPVTLPHRHNKSWEAYMQECLISMLPCPNVYALNNWQDSKGASIEVKLAIALNKNIMYE